MSMPGLVSGKPRKHSLGMVIMSVRGHIWILASTSH